MNCLSHVHVYIQGKKSAKDIKGDKPRSRPGQFEIFTVRVMTRNPHSIDAHDEDNNSTMKIKSSFSVIFPVDSR